jgi:hypothetical protein
LTHFDPLDLLLNGRNEVSKSEYLMQFSSFPFQDEKKKKGWLTFQLPLNPWKLFDPVHGRISLTCHSLTVALLDSAPLHGTEVWEQDLCGIDVKCEDSK